jgi:competence protein ComGC
MRNMVGLLVVLVIVALAYKFYFAKALPTENQTPHQVIDVVGVKNDLIGIAQAERAYQAEHGAYASLDELTSSGSLTMKTTERDGYTYEVETSPGSFRAVAHCPTSVNPGCTSYFVDPSMEVQAAP